MVAGTPVKQPNPGAPPHPENSRKPAPPQPGRTGSLWGEASQRLGVRPDARRGLDAAQSVLTEHPVADKVLPTHRAEPLKDVGDGAVHDGRLRPVLSAEADRLRQCLTTHDEGAVHVNGAGRARVVRRVREQRGTGRLHEPDTLEHADLTVVDALRVHIVSRGAPCGGVGVPTEVVGHVGVDETDVRATDGGHVRLAELGHGTTHIGGSQQVVGVHLVTVGRIGCTAGRVDHVVTGREHVTANGVNRDAGVVADRVGGHRVNRDERRCAELRRRDRCVAVLLEGDGDLRVAHRNRGHVLGLAELGRRRREVGEDGELDGRTGVRCVGRLDVSELVVEQLGAEGEVGKLLERDLIGREISGAGFCCVVVSYCS